MDYVKIQTEVLKAAGKREFDRKPFNWIWSEETSIGGTDFNAISDGHFLVLVPKSFFYLDAEKAFNRTPFNVNTMFSDIPNDVLEDTHTSKAVQAKGDKKGSVHVFKNVDGKNVYVDEKLLKWFTPRWEDNLTFRGNKPTAPIYIYDGDMILGLVLPVKVNE